MSPRFSQLLVFLSDVYDEDPLPPHVYTSYYVGWFSLGFWRGLGIETRTHVTAGSGDTFEEALDDLIELLWDGFHSGDPDTREAYARRVGFKDTLPAFLPTLEKLRKTPVELTPSLERLFSWRINLTDRIIPDENVFEKIYSSLLPGNPYGRYIPEEHQDALTAFQALSDTDRRALLRGKLYDPNNP